MLLALFPFLTLWLKIYPCWFQLLDFPLPFYFSKISGNPTCCRFIFQFCAKLFPASFLSTPCKQLPWYPDNFFLVARSDNTDFWLHVLWKSRLVSAFIPLSLLSSFFFWHFSETGVISILANLLSVVKLLPPPQSLPSHLCDISSWMASH